MRNLRPVDLNLLVAFDTLMSERQVSRAASRIGLSQPGMSNALARLRALFGDDLLVRTANGMEPTARAIELAEPTRQILRSIDRLLASETKFDPGTTTRHFAVRMSDLLEFLLLPHLLQNLRSRAPLATLDVPHLAPQETLDALESDDLDFAISTGLSHPSSIDSIPLFTDRMVCVMRRGHPAAAQPLNLDAFLRLRHARVAISPTDTRFVDNVLADQGLERDIALNVQHWLVLPQVLRNSDLMAVMSARLADAFGSPELVLRPLPFATEPLEWSGYFHRRHRGSAAHKWLRSLIAEVGARIEQARLPDYGRLPS